MEEPQNSNGREAGSSVNVFYAPCDEKIVSILDFGANDEITIEVTRCAPGSMLSLHDGRATRWLTKEEWDAIGTDPAAKA